MKTVTVALVVVLDYEELRKKMEGEGKRKWSAAMELAKSVENLDWVYEVVSVENVTMAKGGVEYEES